MRTNIKNIELAYMQNKIRKILIRKDLINKKKELWLIK